MANGGKRVGSGRKPGYVAKEAEKANEEYVRAVRKRWPELVDAQLDKALGHQELMVTKDGEQRVYMEAPDGKMLEYITNRVLGRPKESVDVTSGGETIAGLISTLDVDR